MKKILLIDADSKIPNIALMKIETFFRQKGITINFKKLNISYYPPHNKLVQINGIGYDKIYVSCIYATTKNQIKINFNDNIEWGGTGIDLIKTLPKDIENINYNYDLYSESEFSYGFITRGCIRNCDFCFVPKKEGNIHKVNDIKDILKHKKIKFLDNNILAYNKHLDIFQEIINKQILCQFNQGLDIRLINNENSNLLNKINYIGEYTFSFDNIHYKKIIEDKLKIFQKYINKDYKIRFFIYCHPNMDIEKNVLYRIEWCKERKFLPYLMRDISCWKSINKKIYIQMARWCNQPNMFKKLTFKQFLEKVGDNNDN